MDIDKTIFLLNEMIENCENANNYDDPKRHDKLDALIYATRYLEAQKEYSKRQKEINDSKFEEGRRIGFEEGRDVGIREGAKRVGPRIISNIYEKLRKCYPKYFSLRPMEESELCMSYRSFCRILKEAEDDLNGTT